MRRETSKYTYAALTWAALIFGAPAIASAQTGVDDDRVSLPEGPGSIEGVGDNVEVDPNMGSMSYSVPIELPGGVNGMTPSLGLSYSSAGGSGVLGVGWSMPEQSISRFTARGTPRYVASDVFAANGGSELVHVGDAGGDQVYRERFEGAFVRYTWKDAGADGHWEAEYPDGSIGYFGAGRDGAPVEAARGVNPAGGTHKYMLVEKVDPFGNSIQYTYTKLDSNWPLLSGVSYAPDAQGSPTYRVELDYEPRQDIISDAGAGYEELCGHRLAGIRVLAQEQVVREYRMSFEDYATSGGFTRLTKVERYGKGGQASGPLYPIAFSFDYSDALGAAGQAAGDRPFLVSMGQVGEAAGLTTGQATFVDLNADGLPDLLDTSQPGAHRVRLGQLTPDGNGGFTHSFQTAFESQLGTSASFGLGDGSTQILDVNGDGLSDLLNTSSGATLLAGYGLTDWSALGPQLDVAPLRTVSIDDVRFIDYNSDKRIDALIGNAGSASVFENQGASFTSRNLGDIGLALTENESAQLADMNGDGVNDLVEVQSSGAIRYKVNLGWGNFGPWKSAAGVTVSPSERPLLDLEDLNGDGVDDLVIVTSSQVKYAINRNGERFDDFVAITSADLAGDLPQRGDGAKVLYADMNANGSEDIVWFSNGEVVYLEMFPVRPNLMSRVDNGIGAVQEVEYSSSAMQEAEARVAGNPWSSSLSIPMNVVSRIDRYVLLTGQPDGSGLHDVIEYTYRDGFYDGVEKQFRGFETVEMKIVASSSQEEGVTTMTYLVGRQAAHLNGRLAAQTVASGGRTLRTESMDHQTCEVAGVPNDSVLQGLGRFPVKFPCERSMTTVIQEGLTQADWVTTQVDMDYDGYGNVTRTANMGVVGVTGDEKFDAATFYTPGDGDRWFINLPLTETSTTIENGSVADGTMTETQYFYDGDDFVGAQSGIDKGFLSRMTVALADGTIEQVRQKPDAFGNVAEEYDPNGTVGNTDSHFRRINYDATGLFPLFVDVHVDANTVLRRKNSFGYDFQKQTEVTDWIVVEGGQEVSPLNLRTFSYDPFGRLSERFEPGDMPNTPAQSFVYELGERFSRITLRMRAEQNGAVDTEIHQCFDGQGRIYQSRARTKAGDYLVAGFSVLNNRGAAVEIFQPYTSDTDACEEARPQNVLATTQRYDADFRVIEVVEPGKDLYGDDFRRTITYAPLATIERDPEDLDMMSPHFETPTTTRTDGLGRVASIERTLAGGESATYQLHYDETSSFAGYTDPDGNRHTLTVDLAGRVTQVANPTTGTSTFTYDDASQLLEATDARGVTMGYAYDGANRLSAVFDKSDRANTEIAYFYDRVPEGCAVTECTNPANRLALVTYPTPWGTGADRKGYDARQRLVVLRQVW